jgi:hypothetical protein
MAAAWNVNGRISSMLFRLSDLRADSCAPIPKRLPNSKIKQALWINAPLSWNAVMFTPRPEFTSGSGAGLGSNTPKASTLCIRVATCVHPELVQNGFTLEAWSKAFLGLEITSLSAQRPLQTRLINWNEGKQDAKLDAILCSRAEIFAQGVLAAKAHLANCQAKGVARELSNSRIIQIPIPTHGASGTIRSGNSLPVAELEQFLL